MIEDNKPNRKRIRLKYFDYSKNGAYFITICTKDKKCILSSIVPPEDSPEQTKPFDQTFEGAVPYGVWRGYSIQVDEFARSS